MHTWKKVLRLLSPIPILFAVFLPYAFLRIIYILGWGYLAADEAGNLLHARDITLCVWVALGVAAIFLARYQSNRVIRYNSGLRALYMLGIAAASLGIMLLFDFFMI